MTPARLVELKCPNCHGRHWVIDSDFRAAYMAGGVDLEYEQRKYACPNCGRQGSGHEVLQKSPPAFFIQPHNMYPMTAQDFQHWLAILKEHFPDHPNLKVIGMSWYPGKERPDHWQRLNVTADAKSNFYIARVLSHLSA